MRNRPGTCAVLIAALILSSEALHSDVVKIRHREGPARGFVVVRDLSGQVVGGGELIQVEKRNRLVSHLILHFKDGSLYDDLTEFTQRDNLKLLRHHLIQSGPSFKLRMETNLDASTGRFTVRYTEKGEEKEINEHLDLAPDVSNGLTWILLKNLDPSTESAEVSMVAASPKPRIIKLQVRREGPATFAVGGKKLRALHFRVHTKISGVAGAVARLLGKQSPDGEIWILDGAVPLFLKFEGPLYSEGPIWQIEPVTAVGPEGPNEPH
jgi:hypothetical protein